MNVAVLQSLTEDPQQGDAILKSGWGTREFLFYLPKIQAYVLPSFYLSSKTTRFLMCQLLSLQGTDPTTCIGECSTRLVRIDVVLRLMGCDGASG